ncbi:MAG: bifunctional 3,4-dihydroxy-2-butanone-4-phosphate synthase/GTP cyclohydrolase II [Pseudomonadota bacterium]
MTSKQHKPAGGQIQAVDSPSSSIEDILDDLRAGKMVIIMDDDSRENEGDLLMLASKVRPEDINFMARYGRGLICLTLGRDHCRQLRLPLMVTETDESHGTNFTVSIEAAEGVTTGISAHDRARTVQAAVTPDAKPEDLTQPGHIFPLMAQPGGVLTRAGHTEAGCDLARLAGDNPAAAVIVEVLREDGSMARRADLDVFAAEHGLRVGTIADLIAYRLRNEPSVERVLTQTVPTEFGDFELHCYEDHVHHNVHIALVRGSIDPLVPTPVRVHLQDTLGDVIGVTWEHLGWPLRSAMERIAREERGVLVILRGQEDARQLLAALGGEAAPADEENDDIAGPRELRTYGIGAQILRDLGVRRMKVMSAPRRMHAISGFGLEIVDYIDDQDDDSGASE